MTEILSDSRTRIRAFDNLMESVDTVLAVPEVVQRLGTAAAELMDVRERAFLPRISGGLVSIPYEYQSTDGIPVIPAAFGSGQNALFIDRTVMQPTPSMREKVIARFLSYGFDVDTADEFIENAVDDMEYPHPLRPDASAWAYIKSGYELHLPTLTRLTARPLVLTHRDLLQEIRIENGLTLLHEFQHVWDYERSAACPVNLAEELAENELRAYSGVARAADGLEAAGCNMALVPSAETARGVDELRREYATPDNPYATPPELVTEMRRRELFVEEYFTALIEMSVEIHGAQQPE